MSSEKGPHVNNRRIARAVALTTVTACTLTATVAPAAPASTTQIGIPGLPPIELPNLPAPQVNTNFDPNIAAQVAVAIASISSGLMALIAFADQWEGRPEPTSEYLSSLMSSDISFQSKNEQQLFLLINKERESRGLKPLTWDNKQLHAARDSAVYQAKQKRLIRASDLASTEIEISSTSDSLWAPTSYREWSDNTPSKKMIFEPTLQSGAIAFYKHNDEGKWYVVFRASTEPAEKPAIITVDPLTEEEISAAASS